MDKNIDSRLSKRMLAVADMVRNCKYHKVRTNGRDICVEESAGESVSAEKSTVDNSAGESVSAGSNFVEKSAGESASAGSNFVENSAGESVSAEKCSVENSTRRGRTGFRVADIGCDHAFVSIYLVQHKIADRVIAADVNPGPLETARKNIESYGLCVSDAGENIDNRIDIRLSNGFEKIKKGETDAAVIAGMGGKLIISIISAADVWVPGYKLVLSPQSDVPEVRLYLLDNGFKIIDEDMVCEDGKYYNIICAEYYNPDDNDSNELPFKMTFEADRAMIMKYGEILIQKKNPVFIENLERRKNALRGICQNLSEPCSELAARRHDEVKKELEEIDRILHLI